MKEIQFYEEADDSLLKFAVIFSEYEGKWVFCKHKERETYECPGGHREPGEDIQKTAERELYEETGALKYQIESIGAYSVTDETGFKDYGMLYFARIIEFGPLPEEFEMEKIEFFTELPEKWTYPEIQPVLLQCVEKNIKI